jgi:hypothetical protein
MREIQVGMTPVFYQPKDGGWQRLTCLMKIHYRVHGRHTLGVIPPGLKPSNKAMNGMILSGLLNLLRSHYREQIMTTMAANCNKQHRYPDRLMQ